MPNPKIRIAIVSWGNIGRAALEAALEAPDMEVCGVVRRKPDPIGYDLPVVDDVQKLGQVDVAAIASPSREVAHTVESYLKQGIATSDSFDIHTDIVALRAQLDPIAKANKVQSVISAGWDPGSDSIARALLQGLAPKGITHTNFGPGMSMGHSVAAKSVPGVIDALSMTIPKGEGVHRRMVYVQLETGANFAAVEAAIKADPYFAHDETYVFDVPSVDELRDMGHGVDLVRKGTSGRACNQHIAFQMRINNPALTGQFLICAARAAVRQVPGCYSTIEIPVVDFLPGEREAWVKRLV